MPIDPKPSRWVLPRPSGVDDIVAVGGDLEAGTILQAYRKGLFPMHLPDGRLAWWSPLSRGIIPLDGLKVSRSLRRSVRSFTTTVDEAFDEVVAGCAEPDRPHGWITDDLSTAYRSLHELGWAHSIETWAGSELVGGLYGVAIGGAFFGESMFHRRSDASKVALVRLVAHLRDCGAALLDVQWATDHLSSLGAVEIPRQEYLERLSGALTLPGCFDDGPVA